MSVYLYLHLQVEFVQQEGYNTYDGYVIPYRYGSSPFVKGERMTDSNRI